MKKRLCIWQVVVLFVIALFLIPAVLMAESGDMEYTIKKGDTLWTISSGHLKDPLLWPKLWRANTNVHNPHLIYPNQVIVIPAELLKDKSRAGKKLVAVKGRNIPIIERQPIVPRDVLLDSGYFSRSFVPVGKIKSRFPDVNSIFGNGDLVHIFSGTKLIPDTKYYIASTASAIRIPVDSAASSPNVEATNNLGDAAGRTLVDATVRTINDGNIKSFSGNLRDAAISTAVDVTVKTLIDADFRLLGVERETVGYLVRIKGILQITGEENGNTMAKIIENYKEINAGDFIIDYFPFNPPYEPVIERTPALSGIIVGVDHSRTPGGKGSVVYLNRGTMHGVEIGDKFRISAGKAPHAIIGSLQVFSVFDEAAVGVITKSEKDVVPGDTFGN
jgi:hypothetical protein